jgi:tryptophanase
MATVYEKRDALTGFEITDAPARLRHFTAHFAPLEDSILA